MEKVDAHININFLIKEKLEIKMLSLKSSTWLSPLDGVLAYLESPLDGVLAASSVIPF